MKLFWVSTSDLPGPKSLLFLRIAEESQVTGYGEWRYGEWSECAQQFRGWFSVLLFTGTTKGCRITIYEEWSERTQQFRGLFCVQMDHPRLIRKADHMKKSPPTGKNSWLCLVFLELEVDFVSMAEDEQQP
ncbi:hypothetical protein F5J12DRAFT_785355 [Pisolithus orientalis]|uniref:uncharacterized protein n=1 Tax=Pisolithus orientalis TaxID=936130 RepID=UPI0022256D60|nr:uncharacterized protein F5J12DRAFT_785355 [Pisolithus orientalis]KAI5996560.1 hypothetical protein F5J12DRAFT_785355 [Pisolithus orientalis]